MDQIEEKLKIENDTFALRRDYKVALANLDRIKKETADIMAVKEKVTKEVDEKKEDLKSVLNDISAEKLEWATFRQGELSEIESKKGEVSAILDKERELDEQEKKIRDIHQENTNILNENRRILLEIGRREDEIEVREREIEHGKSDIEKKSALLDKKLVDFKEEVLKVINQIQKL